MDYYAIHYARYTPSTLAAEIHRCRTMVVDMLARDQRERGRPQRHRKRRWISGRNPART
ncbi:MAG: hypothetical protein JO115_17215 [Pseudonocardiales bacterium]|nr:hypothetical protein [Pseudonocardiales bacterium]